GKGVLLAGNLVKELLCGSLEFGIRARTALGVCGYLQIGFSEELASPKQTALSKNELNSLIVDSLLKIIWLSMHHVIAMKHWLFQSKRLLIVDFLNAQVIQYALMVNLTIYVSCIKQFSAMVSIKKVKDVVKLQALIDRKKVVITEDIIRQDLRLDDADGVDCLPTEEIFAGLAQQPTTTSTSDMTLLSTLLETCTTLSRKVAALEQDKVAQALEILKLKRRVKKLEKQRRSKSSGLKRLRKVSTSQMVESSTETVVGAELQGRLEKKDKVNVAVKEVNTAEW
nr:hypothetical protein [Tanacetum cinerariifolium]